MTEKECPIAHTKIARFFDELESGNVMGTRCHSCGKVYFPPRAECPMCHEEDMDWFEISGKVELVTYTVVEVAPERWKNYIPAAVAVGKLEEGPNFIAVLEGIDPGDIKMGMKLKLIASERPEGYPEPQYRYKFVPG